MAALALVAIAGAPPALAQTVSLPSIRIDGAAAGDMAGTSIAGAGDVNGDGHPDVVIGAPGALPTENGGGGGAAYVVFGPFTAGESIDLANLGTRGFVMRGSNKGLGQSAGTSVAGAGDVNGDGLADVIVGAPAASPSQEGPMTQPGRAYIVFGSRTPRDVTLAALGSAGITLTGESHRFPDAFGWQVAAAGDVNHDGLKDVIVAAPGDPGFEEQYTRGRAYVVYGRRSGGSISMAGLGARGFRIGFGSGGQMTSVAGVGDWNRDGRADVAVADGAALTGRGAVWVIYGRRAGHNTDLAHLGRDGILIAGSRTHHYALEGAVRGRRRRRQRRSSPGPGARRAGGALLRRRPREWRSLAHPRQHLTPHDRPRRAPATAHGSRCSAHADGSLDHPSRSAGSTQTPWRTSSCSPTELPRWSTGPARATR